jgi:hypothetical protein
LGGRAGTLGAPSALRSMDVLSMDVLSMDVLSMIVVLIDKARFPQ